MLKLMPPLENLSGDVLIISNCILICVNLFNLRIQSLFLGINK